LGEILEMSFDGYGVLVAGVLIVQYGQAPAWYLLVAFARYLFVAGIWILRRLNKSVYDLPPSTSRRVLASGQMCLVAALLLPVFAPPGTWFAASLFALPFLAGFLRDWLWVSGVIRRPAAMALWMSRALTVGIPLALRLALPVLAIGTLFQGLQSLDWSMPIPAVFLLLEIGVILAVTFGFAGRIAAVVGLLILGIHQNQTPLTLAQYLMVVDYAAIVFLGTGPYSAWKPEDVLIYRRIGEKQASHKPIGSRYEAPG
jgi:CDP-diacylglycerol--glycerol-3-phosphate 3-phosphatidyltransferase